MKVIDPLVHGIADYGLAAAFLLAPTLFGLSGIPSTLAVTSGVIYLAVSLVTKYPLGFIKAIPFRAHGVLEVALGVLWVASPLLFGFADLPAARNFFLISGIALVLVAATTDYKAASETEERRLRIADRRWNQVVVMRDRRVMTGRRNGGMRI
jgi:hypothetical protein